MGASFIFPARLYVNRLAPTVTVRSVTSGGRTYVDPGRLTLPAGTRSLEIAYTALSLVVPHRDQFRYRLEGVDDGWVNPGTRRSASYSNLGPGKYHFTVIASNNDGVWNRSGATLDFVILPTIFQTWPFFVLCAGLASALLWLFYALRMRAVARGIQARMNERLDERERIVRELHDTLLQSVQGLIMRFSNIAQDIKSIPTAHRDMLDALDTADAVVVQGRDRVQELRRWSGTRSLPDMLRRAAVRLLRPDGVDSSVIVEGVQRAVHPAVADELLRVADEALFNIARHAQARQAAITIIYGSQTLILRIVDDGAGIDREIARQGGAAGHFGLIGMRERTAKIGGRLAISPVSAGGTKVELIVGAEIAYADRQARNRLAWWQRFVAERRNG
jgi:signal transduction histidine kinase